MDIRARTEHASVRTKSSEVQTETGRMIKEHFIIIISREFSKRQKLIISSFLDLKLQVFGYATTGSFIQRVELDCLQGRRIQMLLLKDP